MQPQTFEVQGLCLCRCRHWRRPNTRVDSSMGRSFLFLSSSDVSWIGPPHWTPASRLQFTWAMSNQILSKTIGDEHAQTVGTIKLLGRLYESRHTAEPGQGYDAMAAERRERMSKTEPEGE